MNLDELSQSKSERHEDESILRDGPRILNKDTAKSSLTPLDLFLQDLDRNIANTPLCQELIDIRTGVENLLKDLLLEVEQENPFLKTTLINSGSFYEDTKVDKPDEFDYLVQLDYFSEPTDIQYEELPGASVIALVDKVAPKEKLILLDPIGHSSGDDGLTRRALELFKEIAGTRMKSLGNNLPSYNRTEEFKLGDQEIANFVEFLSYIFRKDLQILLSKL
ncbi:hypothetical protein AWC38_SpisGene12923 [Stylophora pistillata]|uniref:Uncharacterized protein n=1 Tax=Stylophora pistillata TaxID=50429 RepID=A0A2B4S0J2_STYPI|nr:hypothetical protein AWC38_SpisGene12923 [Stylophora pistillata]